MVRENEVEADDYGIEIMTRSNYDLSEMSRFFKIMNNASGEIQRDLAYLSTHPMYENRISHIQNKSNFQDRPITNSTDDYFFVKTISEQIIIKLILEFWPICVWIHGNYF